MYSRFNFSTAAARFAASSAVSRATYSYRTDFIGSGKVQVFLESYLGNLFKGAHLGPSSSKKLPPPVFTGLILSLDKPYSPRAIYELYDELGKVLFSSEDVSDEGFARNFMGRWVKKRSKDAVQPSLLSEIVGKNPMSVRVQVNEAGRLVAKGRPWQIAMTDNHALLREAKIVVLIP